MQFGDPALEAEKPGLLDRESSSDAWALRCCNSLGVGGLVHSTAMEFA